MGNLKCDDLTASIPLFFYEQLKRALIVFTFKNVILVTAGTSIHLGQGQDHT